MAAEAHALGDGLETHIAHPAEAFGTIAEVQEHARRVAGVNGSVELQAPLLVQSQQAVRRYSRCCTDRPDHQSPLNDLDISKPPIPIERARYFRTTDLHSKNLNGLDDLGRMNTFLICMI